MIRILLNLTAAACANGTRSMSLAEHVCSCERYGASRRLLAVFSPAASALRLTVSDVWTAASSTTKTLRSRRKVKLQSNKEI